MQVLKAVLITLFILIIRFHCTCQEKKSTFLPDGILFQSIFLDPTENQYYGGLFALNDSGKWNQEVYIPISLVIHKPIVRFDNKNFSWEIGFEGAGFTQFDIKKIDRRTALGKMLNTDFRGGIFANFNKNIHQIRLRFFHSSSHLADDYILKNDISPRTPSELDYEQIDITYSMQINHTRIYAGTGMVVSPNTVRKRFSIQTGGYYKKYISNTEKVAFVTGADIKIFQQNNYRPNLKLGCGMELGKNNKIPARFIIEYYNGHLPYSTLEYKLVQWIGLSLSFNIN